MHEILAIIQAYHAASAAGKKTALATVVHVEGSSYRRPGARMLITEDAQLTGSISGGCLEGDAFRKALHVILSGKTMLVTYDTADDDDAKFGMGLGCQGVIQVLIEPLQGEEGKAIIDLLSKATASRQPSALITLFSMQDKRSVQYGSCFLLTEEGSEYGVMPFAEDVMVRKELALVLTQQKSSFCKLSHQEAEWIAFTEYIQPPVSLVIVGAGNDVIPLAQMAEIVGWQTTVIDGRPMYASKERFPMPSCQVFHAKAAEVLDHVNIDSRTVFVLMSHNYNYDLGILRTLLNKNIRYIGILGPHKKMKMMIKELADEGLLLTEEQKEAIHGPVGLDIGAETAEEIAVSIIAEIQAKLSAATAAALRTKEEAIHSRADLLIKNPATSSV
ncbi:XdhC family protein [Sediminibacterium goheungense]|uniref:Xanthine/CO dehydrogenase XdhC/CoxF family maturation factor n=1 Tax=Sediminibacterium goheungense TaxID=1086393 RepID=A0A4R6IV32_9BACT|nr:XdhC/CoxI family protein [Sediminibacterium goheungense]TDO25816.1 xanthine/CO dehydrogenase XdhC/CoxF family maturation factor [Sediminibacterium goheungense]